METSSCLPGWVRQLAALGRIASWAVVPHILSDIPSAVQKNTSVSDGNGCKQRGMAVWNEVNTPSRPMTCLSARRATRVK